jgi:guanine deaminase
MTLTPDDHIHLARAVALSREHMHAGAGGPFGSVIGEGGNQVTSTNDPTAHAEMVAIRRACQAVGSFSLAGATLYASCEPCPMCLASAYWARISRIVYANTRDQAAAIGFDDAFIYDEMPKPPAQRVIPMQHAPCEEAQAVFRDWMNNPDRIAY